MSYVPYGPTEMLSQFQQFFTTGQANLMKPAFMLLGILATITLTWAAIQWMADESGGDILKQFIQKIIFIGFFVWFVKQWPWIIEQVTNGFIWVGSTAGGATNVNLIKDPSAILLQGVIAVKSLLKNIVSSNILNFQIFFLNAAEFILIYICYLIIAIQVFLVQLEFGIIATLGIMLVPFGVLKQTSFIAEKVFGYLVNVGIKMMVLTFVLTISFPFLLKLAIPEEPNLFACLNLFSGAAILAFACWKLPNIAAAMLSGAPSLASQDTAGGLSRIEQSVKTAVKLALTPKGVGAAATRAAARGGKS